MSIDISNEIVIPLAEAVKHIPGRPHVSTLYRWVAKRDNPLETVKIGGRVYTSIEAIQRFADRCTNPITTQTRTSQRRQRDIERAESELSAVGI